ncbi:MAG: MFS transporter [Chloroflexi bacterium]|nr:MFS transporter [Chloroflexota bacterium]
MADTVDAPSRHPRIFHGWYIVGIAVTSSMLLSGFQTYAFGFFFKPMSEELEIGRGATSAVLLIRAVIMGALALPIGMAVDRYGPKALMALGIIIAGMSTIGMAWVGSLLSFYLVFGVLRSLALALAGGEVTSTVVAKWFVRHRALALAITSTGIPLGGILMAPLAALLISQFDWRSAFVIFGVITIVVLLVPSWLVMRRMPEDIGLRPDGELPRPPPPESDAAAQPAATPRANPVERDWTMAEAVRTPSLWLITLSLNLTIFMTTSITLHQVPYLTDKGFSAGLAAAAIILLTTVALLVKFFWGWMAARIPIRYCIAMSQTLDVAALILLLTVSTTWSVIAYAFVFGLGRSEGLFGSHAYAVYFGRRFLGSTRGIVAPIRIAASGGGPLITGIFFDVTGDYNTIIPIFIGVTVLAVGCSLLAKPPKLSAAKAAAEAGER